VLSACCCAFPPLAADASGGATDRRRKEDTTMNERHWELGHLLRPSGAVVFASWAGATPAVPAGYVPHSMLSAAQAAPGPLWRRLVGPGAVNWLLGR
jgi:hypothetical protein